MLMINLRTLVLLTGALLILRNPLFAQEATHTAPLTDDSTNAPLLKDMMVSNNIVTNTAEIVLVKISDGLWAGRYEVTQDSYRKVMHSNPSVFKGSQNPVDSVSWDDAMAFCSKLTQEEQKSGDLTNDLAYALPTESEWEQLVGDASLKDAVMQLNGKYTSPARVGSLGPNHLGLYDMRGNVLEWCLDSHDPTYHVLRGGAWDTVSEPSSRLEFRWYAHLTDKPQGNFGFRVLLKGGAK